LVHGQYVTAKAMEAELYPRFLGEVGWDAMPWRTVSIALGRLAKVGKVTRKRDREFRCAQGGEWRRRSIAQFLVPRPDASARPAPARSTRQGL